jgi:hypothetical protein
MEVSTGSTGGGSSLSGILADLPVALLLREDG